MARSRRTTRLDVWINSTATPVALVSGDRKVVFLNSGFTSLTGWSADDVVGHVCEYRSDSKDRSVEALLCCLCPPPEVLAGSRRSVPTYLPKRVGGTHTTMLEFVPLMDAENAVDSVLIFAGDIKQPAARQTSPIQQLHAELAAARLQVRQRYGLSTFVGKSRLMTQVLEQIRLATHCDAPLWISGDRGVGKHHIARTIHYQSERRDSAFVPVLCRQLGARELRNIVQRLLEGTGESQAATSAGTVHFADVDAMPRDVQHAVFERIDSARPSIRLSCSSRLCPDEAISQADFDDDLARLLSTISINVPELKRRYDEIELLAQSMLEELNHGRPQQLSGFSPDVLAQFQDYQWPGNVAELKAVVEQCVEVCETETIDTQHLPFRFRTGVQAQEVGPSTTPQIVPLDQFLKDVEREHIEHVLRLCHDNKSKAAQLLGMSRPKFYRRLETLGIEDH